ncbi:hypothetical protein [Aquimarina mytili]|uniref:Uncharacterized protein n=1 Tax=Aquimarina mytili TaxID=874423 RepID=A0A937D516_9FLAO|nr:hypothetical protein [Aquimarina mytili]MBL0682809.1 hypothetical protein [Aquimarina mytili]
MKTIKTIKTLFAILFLSTFFIACEADSVNEEIGIEINDGIEKLSLEDDEGSVQPESSSN